MLLTKFCATALALPPRQTQAAAAVKSRWFSVPITTIGPSKNALPSRRRLKAARGNKSCKAALLRLLPWRRRRVYKKKALNFTSREKRLFNSSCKRMHYFLNKNCKYFCIIFAAGRCRHMSLDLMTRFAAGNLEPLVPKFFLAKHAGLSLRL